MRENKFRAWADGRLWYPDPKREDWWFFGCEGYWSLNDGRVIGRILCDSLKSTGPVLEQYTGLKDKDGREIYEGDIMTHPDFSPGSAYKISFENGYFNLGGWDCIRTDITQGVIVGNIHENPSLLAK